MTVINRRKALGLSTAAGIGLVTQAAAQPFHHPHAAAPPAPPPFSPADAAHNPVLFWNAVSLDLVALDHSIDAANAAAPGPCASSRALGVIHAVIADAVSVAYGANYYPQFYKGPPPRIRVPAMFVGGAAAGIMAHIYNSPIHAYSIGSSRQAFQIMVGHNEGDDWQQGLAFANYPLFREMWKWNEYRPKIMPQLSNYIPRPRKHNTDPYNAGQGFYATHWGTVEPLILTKQQVPGLAPPPPPPEGSPEYERDLAEVAVIGALDSRETRHFPARTREQTHIGLFWAYCGTREIGTPPRLYNQILRHIAIADGLDVAETARWFALYNIALADASIVCWWGKYKYAVWRPVIGIQNHAVAPIPDWRPFGAPKTNPPCFQCGPDTPTFDTAISLLGGGPSLLSQQLRFGAPLDYVALKRWYDQEENSYRKAAFTPNFPSYPSGHATFGGACFHLVKLLRRERPQTAHNPDRIDIEVVSDELNGMAIDAFTNQPRPLLPVRFKSIEGMIQDNEASRIYLGIHWRFDQNRGTESGRRVADQIYHAAYHYRKFHP